MAWPLSLACPLRCVRFSSKNRHSPAGIERPSCQKRLRATAANNSITRRRRPATSVGPRARAPSQPCIDDQLDAGWLQNGQVLGLMTSSLQLGRWNSACRNDEILSVFNAGTLWLPAFTGKGARAAKRLDEDMIRRLFWSLFVVVLACSAGGAAEVQRVVTGIDQNDRAVVLFDSSRLSSREGQATRQQMCGSPIHCRPVSLSQQMR